METVSRVRAQNEVEEAIVSRRSVRGFRPDPVDPDLVVHLLDIAARAPSGSNIQPWSVHVLTGPALARLSDDLTMAYMSEDLERPEYHYYPRNWRTPYIERRRTTGWSLYKLTGVERGDHEAGKRQRARNYSFFGAPVGVVFLIDRDMEIGSWLDYGMFLQNIMVAARSHGLSTCPQQSIANYPDIVARHIPVEEVQMIVCGMALGYDDPNEPANALLTSREPATEFAVVHSE